MTYGNSGCGLVPINHVLNFKRTLSITSGIWEFEKIVDIPKQLLRNEGPDVAIEDYACLLIRNT